MKIYEFVTIIALVAGPVVAVVLTLWSQARSAMRDRQLSTLRMLLASRTRVGDPAYSVAINMIPIEFSGNRSVQSAWRAFLQNVQHLPSPENQANHSLDFAVKQTKLIFEMSKVLGYKLAETDIQTSGYAAQAWIDREELNIRAQNAWIRIADALEKQAG